MLRSTARVFNRINQNPSRSFRIATQVTAVGVGTFTGVMAERPHFQLLLQNHRLQSTRTQTTKSSTVEPPVIRMGLKNY